MGMSSSLELKVRAFSGAAKKRVMEISLKDYNLIDWTETDPILVCEDSGLPAGRNDFKELMERIAEALNGEGMAYLIEAVDEDIPYATTFFYLGNGVKVKKFETDPFDLDDEEDPWEAAIERRKTYVPRVEWIKGAKYSAVEKELLEKNPWIDEEDNECGEDSDNEDFIVFDDGLLYKYDGDIVIPKGVKVIGEEIFQDMDLESVIIPEGVTCIGFGAFGGCENLVRVVIPDSMEVIEDSAFCDCTSLRDLKLPDSVIKIGQHAFESTAIGQIMIPKGIDRIEEGTYSYCDNLSVVVIPEHITRIGMYAFSLCNNLTEVVLPDTITEIEDQAFESCSNLKKVNIPSGVTSLGTDIFDGCDELIITVAKGSYAEEYCKEAGLKYVYPEASR